MISELFLMARYFATAIKGKQNPGVRAAITAFFVRSSVFLKYFMTTYR
jgi:hypothetical protein